MILDPIHPRARLFATATTLLLLLPPSGILPLRATLASSKILATIDILFRSPVLGVFWRRFPPPNVLNFDCFYTGVYVCRDESKCMLHAIEINELPYLKRVFFRGCETVMGFFFPNSHAIEHVMTRGRRTKKNRFMFFPP